MKLEIDYSINDNLWLDFIKENEIEKYISNIFHKVIEVLEYKLNKKNTIELSITFTNDEEIKEINKNYRQKDSATNVLSFPLFEKEFLNEYNKSPYVALGDVVLSLNTIEKEAKEQNKSFNDHLTHLLIHSLLHLFGYDHIKDSDAEKMEEIEVKILENINIENPYK